MCILSLFGWRFHPSGSFSYKGNLGAAQITPAAPFKGRGPLERWKGKAFDLTFERNMQMNSILNRLYRSEIRPDEADQPMMEELPAARRDYARRRDKLLASLDAPLKEKVEALLEEREEVAALEKEDAYVRGTRMGARMAAALLNE